MARQTDLPPKSPEQERGELRTCLNDVSDQLATEIRTLCVLEDALTSLSRRTDGHVSKSVQGIEEVLYRHQERLTDLYERLKD